MFAKIFETEKYGQILVKFDESDENTPEIRFYFKPTDMGVCSLAAQYKDTEKDRELSRDYFEKVDEFSAIAVIDKAAAALGFQ